MEQKFTVDEFAVFLGAQDSFGDAMYFLSEENVFKANVEIECANCEQLAEYNQNADTYKCPVCNEECYEEE